MAEAFICDAVRTPIGRYSGALSAVRADDLAAIPLKALMDRNPRVDWTAVDDLIYGCANQSRRRQSQRCPHGGAAVRSAGHRPGRDD